MAESRKSERKICVEKSATNNVQHKQILNKRTEVFKEKGNVITIVVDNFSEYIKVADARSVKPIIKGKRKIPKKYLDETKYGFDMKQRLIELETGKVVPSNPKVAGTPRYWRVNGQDIYNQKVKTFQRNNYVGMLHRYFEKIFTEKFENIRIKKFPLRLSIIFHVKDLEDHNIDNDNKWIWEKVIQDTLVECRILPDDNPRFICENSKKTVLVQNEEDVKLIIKLDYVGE